MSKTARILKFPNRRICEPVSERESQKAAEVYLDSPVECRDLDLTPDLVFGICSVLREKTDVDPANVFAESARLYRSIVESNAKIGLFDETDYVLGELALLAAKAGRQLGKLTESELWLERADSFFRHTVNPGPQLANVAFARLALRYAGRRYDDVLELIPSLIKSYESFGMSREIAKSKYLEAISLKQAGRSSESFAKLQNLALNPTAQDEPAVLGQTFVEIGAYLAAQGDFAQAMASYQKALGVLSQANRPISIAHLKWAIGEMLRREGRLGDALAALRESHRDFAALEMCDFVVFLNLAIAETLLAMDRPREAEWEILAALPIIEEQKMVPEGFAAVALLKESVRRRKTDPNALRELREHLQANR